MKYIVYQTINKVNNKIYIGVHGTQHENIFDGYIGCGVDIYRPASYLNPKTPFQCAVKKYGPKAFTRTTLQIFDNEEDAYTLEAKLVNKEFVQIIIQYKEENYVKFEKYNEKTHIVMEILDTVRKQAGIKF